MVYWEVDQVTGSEMERAYGRWEGHQVEWHDRMELGDRVADAFVAQLAA